MGYPYAVECVTSAQRPARCGAYVNNLCQVLRISEFGRAHGLPGFCFSGCEHRSGRVCAPRPFPFVDAGFKLSRTHFGADDSTC